MDSHDIMTTDLIHTLRFTNCLNKVDEENNRKIVKNGIRNLLVQESSFEALVFIDDIFGTDTDMVEIVFSNQKLEKIETISRYQCYICVR